MNCLCGCGGIIPSLGKGYMRGHNRRRRDPDYVICPSGYDSPCWIWQHAISPSGYGLVRWRGSTRHAHRAYYEQHVGPIPDDLYVLHRCDVRPCVNPDHLFLGTHQDNMDDMCAKGRQRQGLLPRGSTHHCAKLDEEQVAEIIRRYAAGGISQERLGREFGVSQVHVSRIVRRKGWRHVDEASV